MRLLERGKHDGSMEITGRTGLTVLSVVSFLMIAATSARFGLPEITLGLFPGAGGSQRLTRQVPRCKAMELMYLGGRIAAADAERIGRRYQRPVWASRIPSGYGSG